MVEKTATVTDEGDGSVGAGDVINYIITVRNSGNVTITGLTVSDTISDANSTTLTMSTGPSFSGSDRAPIPVLSLLVKLLLTLHIISFQIRQQPHFK